MTNGSKELNLSFFEFVELDDSDSGNKGLKPVDNDSIYLNLKDVLFQSFNTEKKLREVNSISDLNGYGVIIIFTKMKYLHDPDTYEKRLNEEIRKYSKHIKDDLTEYKPYPIVLIGLEDLPGVLEEKIKVQPNEQKKERLKSQLSIVNALNLDAKVNFFDSSIWHCYIPLDENFLENFEKIFGELKYNFELNLYETNVAKEFLEFHTRLLKNSYLAKLGGAHATKVTPFHFHSAMEMEIKTARVVKGFKDAKMNYKFNWRLLLLDDYAHTGLRCSQQSEGQSEDYGEGTGPNKIKIIRKVLGLSEKLKDDDWIKVHYVEDVNKSYLEGFYNIFSKNPVERDEQQSYNFNNDGKNKKVEAEVNQIYDIILIDYLLSGDNKNEYCTDIFRWIKNKREYNTSLQGPLGKLWFFPISVFSYALHEEIRQMGFTHFEDEWHLARGADPVNTPQLFRYSLFKFMEMQKNEVLVKINGLEKFFENHPVKNFAVGNGAKTDTGETNAEFVPLWASGIIGSFLYKFGKHEILYLDKRQNSLFAKTMCKAIEKRKRKPGNEYSFYEHVKHLLFLLAYGSGIEWPEMWEEYNFLTNYLEDDVIGRLDKEILAPIRSYISKQQTLFG